MREGTHVTPALEQTLCLFIIICFVLSAKQEAMVVKNVKAGP